MATRVNAPVEHSKCQDLYDGECFLVPNDGRDHKVRLLPKKVIRFQDVGEGSIGLSVRVLDGERVVESYVPEAKKRLPVLTAHGGKLEFWTEQPWLPGGRELKLGQGDGELSLSLPDELFQGEGPISILTGRFQAQPPLISQEFLDGAKPTIPAAPPDAGFLEDTVFVAHLEKDLVQGEGLKPGENSLEDLSPDGKERFARLLVRNAASNAGYVLDYWEILRDFFPDGRFEIRTIKGYDYVVFKGRPGLRKYFKGTKYRLNNPRMLFMSFSKGMTGAAAAAGKSGLSDLTSAASGNFRKVSRVAKIGFVIIGFLETADWVWDGLCADKGMYLSSLLIGVGSAVFKGWAAAMAGGLAAGVAASLIISPPGLLLAVAGGAFLIAAIAVGAVLDFFDEQFGLTRSLKDLAIKVDVDLKRLYKEGLAQLYQSFDYHGEEIWGIGYQ